MVVSGSMTVVGGSGVGMGMSLLICTSCVLNVPLRWRSTSCVLGVSGAVCSQSPSNLSFFLVCCEVEGGGCVASILFVILCY